MPAPGARRGIEGDVPSGDLVQVAYADDPFNAEMIQGLLENAGIPCLLRPAGMTVDGPQLGFGLLARGFGGGPQRVMVHAGKVEAARAVLAETLVEDEEEGWSETTNARHLEEARGGRKPRGYGLVGAYARIWLWSLLAFAVAFGVFVLLRAV
jgi:hypothetical protein